MKLGTTYATSSATAHEVMTSVGRWANPEACRSNLCVRKHRMNRGFRCDAAFSNRGEGPDAWDIECVRGRRGSPRTRDGGAHAAASARYKSGMAGHRIYRTSVASVYPHYVSKVEKKGRTKEEVDEILCWLTGYGASELGAQLEQGTDFETFFAEAPALNPSRKLITGVICGVRVEEIEDPLMQEIRYLDKLVDGAQARRWRRSSAGSDLAPDGDRETFLYQ